MRSWITCLFFLVGTMVYGQVSSLESYLAWFNHGDTQTIKDNFKESDFHLINDKDSNDIHILKYVLLLPDIKPSFTFLIGDSSLLQLTIENYNQNVHKSIISHIKSNKFKNINADVNGDFITTVYDNGQFIFCQDYQVIDNPSGKGQIPYYRYRMYRKYGPFDELNGEKTVTFSQDGLAYVGIRENYKNGVLSGERTFYYPNGTIKRKENYQAGRLNGLVSDFDPEGRLTHSVTHSYHWKYGMEKWYDGQGKLVKTLQWQRDVPIGSEKYTISGRTFSGPTYKKGKKEGITTIPVGINWSEGFGGERFPFPVDLDWEKSEWTITKVKAIEIVNFVDNIKIGKAIGLSPFSNDTLYTCYYKNGILDSVFTAYQLTTFVKTNTNGPVAQTTFMNGLENGKRTIWIRSGQYKDSVLYEENYVNGKLNGEAIQYYSRSVSLESDWFPIKDKAYYIDGKLTGSFSHYQDANNYQFGSYLNNSLDGETEYMQRSEKHWIKGIEHYKEGVKIGEWVTENILDSIVKIENYLNDKKHGLETTTVKGKLLEERFYNEDALIRLKQFQKNGYQRFTFEKIERLDSAIVTYELKNGDSKFSYQYLVAPRNFSGKDTVLASIVKVIQDDPTFHKNLNGKFQLQTADYEKLGMYKNGKLEGIILIKNKNAEVFEQLIYENDSIVSYGYTSFETHEAYSGTFTSDYSGEHISVKNGLRHGWCIEYDKMGSEIRRTKYVKGIVRKTIDT